MKHASVSSLVRSLVWGLLGASAFLAGFVAAPASAVVPGEVSYQGLLLDGVGAPVTASVAMNFELFDAAVAGSSLWNESHPSVQVVDGVYDVRLGSITPLTATLVAGGTLYLEVSVDGDSLSPRQPLLVVPYALRSAVAENTEQVDGFSAAYFAEILEHVDFDGGPPSLDPREGLADPDADGIANFVDADNDNDGLSDSAEISQGSDINLVTPTISGFSPSTADGFVTGNVQVQGTNFDPGLTLVFGTESPTPTNVTATSFDVSVGPQPEGTAGVSVTLPNAESAASSFDFFFFVPTISGFSPSTADGFETGSVQVQGTNFDPGLTVVFGSESPTPTNVTATSFDVLVGPQPEGAASVVVTLPNGKSGSSSFDFFFLVPSIDSFSPSRFDQGQAGTVTVTGQNFISGMTVSFGGQSPTPTNISPTSFDVAVAGSEPPGSVSVTVTLPNGKTTTEPTGFEVSVGSPRVIFVSDAETTGALGGLAGADATCQSLASNAGLPGSFQAWLADSTNSPSTRESQVGAPFVRTDAVTIANDWSDLTDGSIAAAISVDQNGASVAGETSVWTNVAAVGAGAETINHCSDWTSAAGGVGGRRGDRTATNGSWTEVGSGFFCDATLRLYCVEQ